MRRSSGFTLVEILVALAVSAVVLSAALVAANAQQRAFYGGQKIRAAQNAGRSALLFIEQKLPSAGFGMDPALAFDFGWYPRTICPASMSPCAPDKTGDTDELVFYARNPMYWVPSDPNGEPQGRAWHMSAITASAVTVKVRADDVARGQVFRKGQILQAVCPGDPRYAYFTVGATTPVGTTVGDLLVPLAPVVTTNPFMRQDVAAAQTCLLPAGRLFLIDRYRLHVRPVQGAAGWNPYLVLDTGTDLDGLGSVGEEDEVLIAEGIEAFQVSYQFTTPSLIAGATPGTALTINTTNPADATPDTVTQTAFPGTVAPGQFDYAPSSFYPYRTLTPLPPERLTNHQANIRTVRISLVARSPEPDVSTPANLTWAAGSKLFMQNQSAAPAWLPAANDRYQRVVLETSVNLPNMTVRGMSYF